MLTQVEMNDQDDDASVCELTEEQYLHYCAHLITLGCVTNVVHKVIYDVNENVVHDQDDKCD